MAMSLYSVRLDAIEAAIDLVGKHKPGDTEDFVARYAMLMLLSFFDPKLWNMVPQFMTQVGRFPDIAIERFRTHRNGTKHFVPSVWVEFKSYINVTPMAAIRQLLDTIKVKDGFLVSRWGYLLGIQGHKWLFMEYNVFLTEDDQEKEYTIQAYPFTADDELLDDEAARPQIRRSLYTEENFETGKGFDLDIRENRQDIIDILLWISRKNRPRDLSALVAK